MYPFRKIVAATDFGESSRYAVDMAAALCAAHGSKLVLVHAYTIFVPIYPIAIEPPIENIREAATAAMERAVSELRPRLPDVTGFSRHGEAWKEILAQADAENADLIVMGTHGHRGVSRVFLGSVAEKVVRLSTIPVLTVRMPEAVAKQAAA